MNAEETLLLDCARYALDPRASPPPTLPPAFDGAALLRTARKNRAMAALISTGKSLPGLWPEAFARELAAQHYSYVVHAEPAVQRVQATLAALAQAGIPAVVLKGWETIYTVYGGDYSLRPCGDIDVLVRPAHARAAEQLLTGAGFEPYMEMWPGFRHRYHNTAWHYQLGGQGAFGFSFGIDLHWGLFNRRYYDRCIAIEALFERAQPLQLGAASAYRLCAEDHILHACGHHSLHHDLHHGDSPEMFRFYELAWVIRRADPPVDWRTLFDRATQWKLRPALQAVLARLEERFPGALPAPALAGLAQLRPPAEEARAFAQLVRYQPTPLGKVLPWRWTPASVWGAMCFLCEAFIPGPQFLQRRYGQTRFWPLHYLTRMGNTVKQLVRFAKNQAHPST